MAIKVFVLFPQEDDDILVIDSPQIAQEMIQTALKLRQIIRQHSHEIELFYDSQNLKTFLQKIAVLFEHEYLQKPSTQLKISLQSSTDWRMSAVQQAECSYVLWCLEQFEVKAVSNSTLAEMAERILSQNSEKYVLLNLQQNSRINRDFLPVFKDCKHIKGLPQFAHVELIADEKAFQLWWARYQKEEGKNHFSLLNRQRFSKTHLVEQGKSVYKEISTSCYWYLDNLHKDHYEVFNAQGEHIGIADLQGVIDDSKKEKGRRIEVN
jgi:hypothetical protein